MKNNTIILNHIVIDLFLGTKPQTEGSTILADRYHKTSSQLDFLQMKTKLRSESECVDKATKERPWNFYQVVF